MKHSCREVSYFLVNPLPQIIILSLPKCFQTSTAHIIKRIKRHTLQCENEDLRHCDARLFDRVIRLTQNKNITRVVRKLESPSLLDLNVLTLIPNFVKIG
jgi:hypothetical protein